MRFRFAILGLLVALLAGCSGHNPARVDYCLAALTGLAPGGRLLAIDIAAADREVTVTYRREGYDLVRRIVCRFSGSAVSLDQLTLEGVTLDGIDLGAGRLAFLKSHWLATGSLAERRQRLVLPDEGFMVMPVSVGRYLQTGLSALPIASVYVLLALGFALVHGITGRINIAHGEFATVGAYAAFVGFMALGASGAPWGIAAALLLAAVAAGSAGLATIGAVFAPLARRDGQMLLVASAGLIIVYEEGIRIAHDSRELWLPPIYADPMALTLPPYVVTVTAMQAATAAATALVVLGVALFMRASRFGLAWRAVADDGLAARLMGVDPRRVLGLAAVLAAALAGWAGLVILLNYGNTNHAMGLMLTVKAMVGALLGGLGSLGGAIAGALILVTVETMWVALFGGAYREVAVFAILVGLLTLAPDGLFARARS